MTTTTNAPHGDSDPARKGGTGASIVTQGDAANLVLPDETVDLVVTSPP
jgi:ubiquinone/menaquinone biosynthesis C-methylase UbiE